jgi:hypothetical protein
MLNLNILSQALRDHPTASLKIVLPDGSAVPPNFHITELALVTKDFFDCGGTRRTDRAWSLQAWVAGDTDHRLAPTKLAAILALHRELGEAGDLPLRIEYQGATLQTYELAELCAGPGILELKLLPIFTDCLAKDRCGILPANIPALQANPCCPPGCC